MKLPLERTMENDDEPVGRVLSRREALKVLAAAGVGIAAGCGPGEPATAGSGAAAAQVPRGAMAGANMLPSCIVRPEQTIGPYFVADRLQRADIRSEPADGSLKEGAPLELTFRVSEIAAGGCAPFAGALVDVWQCDALGAYSGVNDAGAGFNTVGGKFLRGFQMTDDTGVARFTTIFPGWYRGRTVHVHFRIRTAPTATQDYDFTSQIYFEDGVTDEIHARAPYASRGRRDTTNATDGIFRQNGEQLLVKLSQSTAGYAGTLDIGLDLSDARVGAPDDQGGGRRRG